MVTSSELKLIWFWTFFFWRWKRLLSSNSFLTRWLNYVLVKRYARLILFCEVALIKRLSGLFVAIAHSKSLKYLVYNGTANDWLPYGSSSVTVKGLTQCLSCLWKRLFYNFPQRIFCSVQFVYPAHYYLFLKLVREQDGMARIQIERPPICSR